tara:strand:- start:8485 stop:9009 length:525 start_codon:yes stop_codon:yes gene_type:complete
MTFFTSKINANYEKIFFDYSINSVNGELIELKKYKNKKAILIVNTASYCGFTKQYNDMQLIWDKYKKDGLIVIAVPSNSFNQEKKNEKEVKEFCDVNFNITFPITSIYDVKGEDAHDIFKWAKKNFGKSAVPKWNFHKILINGDGKVEETYSSFTNPGSNKIINKIEKLLEIQS